MSYGGIASLTLGGLTTGLLSGLSFNETHKAKKEAKKQQRLQNKLILQQKTEALQRRKSLINQQRYNLLGSIDNNNTNNILG